MRDAFVARWEEFHGDKYPFEPKDATSLAAMIKKHPQLVERWYEMLDWYFADAFWGSKRHPLIGLCTNPVQFSGPANNLPAKVAASRDAVRGWARGGR